MRVLVRSVPYGWAFDSLVVGVVCIFNSAQLEAGQVSASTVNSTNYGLDSAFRAHLRRNYGPTSSHQSDDVTLRRRLGRRFDRDWMSTFQPSLHERRCPHLRHNSTQPMTSRSSQNRSTTREIGRRCGSRSTHTCFVTYKWRNLGRYYWPQWVKDTKCSRSGCSKTSSSSVCQANQTKTLHIFTWQCRQQPQRAKRRRNCKRAQVNAEERTNCVIASQETVAMRRTERTLQERRIPRLRLRCRFVRTRFFVTSSCKCKEHW